MGKEDDPDVSVIADSHTHDVELLFSGDSPHPTRLECRNCEWVGEVQDAV